MEDAGVNIAWQQAQERKNRDLKVYQNQKSHRSVSDVIQEFKTAIDEQRQQEIRALFGEGEYRLIPRLKHLLLTKTAWLALSAEDRKQHFLNYENCSAGK